MESRYWLCFESGERRGESLPIPEPGLVVGRASGCGLRLAEPSISGEHARFELEAQGVRVTDLGSRNGTLVNGARVEQLVLAHGDQLKLGKLRFSLVDRALAGGAGSEARTLPSGAAPADDQERLIRVDSGRLLASRKLSPVVWIAVALGVGAGGFYAWRELSAPERATLRIRPVVAVDGELLADGSFEQPSTLATWETVDASAFEVASAHRHRGRLGLGVDLAGGRTVRIASPWCRVREGRAVAATAWTRVGAGLEARASLELSSTAAADRSLELLGTRLPTSEAFEELRLRETVLPGFDRARLVLSVGASDSGLLSLDDVSLVEAEPAAGRVLVFEEYELHLHGSSPMSASLVRIDRVAATGLRFLDGARAIPFEAAASATGMSLRPRETGPSLRFSFVVLDTLAAPGLATLHGGTEASGGALRPRPGEFTAEAASGLLAGEGTTLVHFAFEAPVRLESRRAPEGLHVSAGPVGGAVELQLSFRDERNRAADLAEAASQAERAGQPGESLARWAELLRSVPFDASLVARAEEARSELLRVGLDQVEAVRAEFTRARFFDLPDIYRRSARRVAELRERYAGSEVEEAAERLDLEIEAALAAHVDEERSAQRERLARVAEILERTGAVELADHVRGEVEADSGDGGGGR